MQTLLLLLLTFIIVIFLIYIFFKSKQSRLNELLNGTCPACGEEKISFFDTNTNQTFVKHIIITKVLKDHGCSGLKDVEFTCKSCGLKEIHSINSQMGCGI
jgi:DNA-directed RNA polymerase subunit M/transcription elongation factor TFIIS